MIEINLLPWREMRRKHARYEILLFVLTGAFLALGIILILHFTYESKNQKLYRQNKNNQREMGYAKQTLSYYRSLNQFSKKVSAQQKQHEFLIKTLASFLPGTIFLSTLTLKNSEIMLQGQAISSLDLMRFMQNLSEKKAFASLQLVNIKNSLHSSDLQFQLKISLKKS